MTETLPVRTNHSVAVILTAILVFALFQLPLQNVEAATVTTNTFVLTGSTWGTGTTSLEVGPGSLNVPLVVSFQYLGSSQASRVQATLGLPSGITDIYGSAQPSSSTISVNTNTAFSLTYYVNIPQSVPVGSYSISVGMKWNYTSQATPGFFIESHSFSVRILGTVQMSAQASQTSLNAGEVNNVTITLTNRGSGTATQINPTVTTSAGSVLTILPLVASLAGGSAVSFPVSLYVPSTYAGAAVIVTLSTSFTDSYGNGGTSSLPVGFYAVNVPEPVLSFTAAGEALTPGQVNDVSVTLSNRGPGTATSVRTTVTAPTGFSVLGQFPEIVSIQAGGSVNSTLRVFAPTSASGSAAILTFSVTFTDPYGYSVTSTLTVGLYTTSSSAISAATSLAVLTTSNSLVEGQRSLVAFTIKNTGQQTVYSPTVSLTIASPLVVSANSTITLAGAVISPGVSVRYNAEVTTGTTATGGFYSGTLTIAYTDQFGDTHTQTVPVAFVVTLPVLQVTVSSISSQIAVGKSSQVSFMVVNSGTAPVYSPTFSLTVPSGLAVTTNATFSRSGLVINPGQTVKYVANVTDGPKTAEGAYISSVTVSYADQFGNAHTQAFSLGLVAVGGIQMVIQNERFSKNGTSVSVTGTLLNEGLAIAYYTQVSATLLSGTTQIGSATQYIGEVDPNTPLPIAMSFTVPSTATNGTGSLELTANYQNDFGQSLQFKNSVRAPLSGGSSTGASTGSTTGAAAGVSDTTVNLVRYGLLIAILVALAAVVIYVRRGRSKRSKARTGKSDVY